MSLGDLRGNSPCSLPPVFQLQSQDGATPQLSTARLLDAIRMGGRGRQNREVACSVGCRRSSTLSEGLGVRAARAGTLCPPD